MVNAAQAAPANPAPKGKGNGRETLITAAKELFWLNGFESTSPKDLIRFSGVGQGSFYHHFPSKLALLNAVLELVADQEIEILEQLQAQAVAPFERLKRYLTLPRKGQRGCRICRFTYESSVEKAEVNQPIRRYMRAVEAFLIENIQQAQARAELSTRLPAADLALLMIGSVQGGYILARAFGETECLNRSVHAVLALLESLRPA